MAGPADITGLSFHLRADTGLWQDSAGTTPATADGAFVGRWEDLGPNGWHLTQPTNARRPTLDLVSAFKGEPAVRFDGATQQWLTNAAFNATSGVSAGTWFLCFQSDSTGTSPIVSPSSNALGFADDNSAHYFYHHGGAAEHGHFSFYRPAIGKCVLASYDAAGVGNAGRLKVRANTYDRTLAYDGAAIEATAYAVSAGLWVGKDWSTATFATMRLLEVAYWPRVLTTTERDALEAYARTRYFGHGRGYVQCVGDSLTRGYPNNMSNESDYPSLLQELLGVDYTVYNRGQVAYTIAQLLATFGPTVDPARDEWADLKNGGKGDFLVSQGGTNNLNPASNDQEAGACLAEQQASVAHWQGWLRPVIVTTVPHVGTVGEESEINHADMLIFNARADTYNAAALAGDTGADAVVDWHTGEFADPTDADYFYAGDRVHFEAPLNQVAAERIYDAIMDLTGDPPPDPVGTRLIQPFVSPNGGILFFKLP